MTSLPAQLIGIKDRGILRKGYKADILIFDPKKVHANATFESPHVLATGFDYVLINGSQKTGNGKLLKRN
jgi:N-acyl-D-amino-acid deacylase